MGRIGAWLHALRKTPIDAAAFDGSRPSRTEFDAVVAGAPATSSASSPQAPAPRKTDEPPSPAPPTGPDPNSGFKWGVARAAGALTAGTAIAGVSLALWGPAAAAYYLSGSLAKALAYNAKALGPFGGVARWVGENSGTLRLMAGVGLITLGMATGNPLATYFGMSFGILTAGEEVGRAVFSGAEKLLSSRPVTAAARAIDGAASAGWHGLRKLLHIPDQEPAPPSGKPSWLRRAGQEIYEHRGSIARVALASAATALAVGGFGLGVHAALDHAIGTMAATPGSLTWQDKARNSLIGGYRLYNGPGTIFKKGPNTDKFYAEMKAKYNPKTPEEWAQVIEREITWVEHQKLYGTNMYYITSEEAAAIRSYGGIVGHYSDCTGKAALLQNLLKLDGFGESQIRIGSPTLDKIFKDSGHAWITNPNAADPAHELFHYDNTKNLLLTQEIKPAQGLRGDLMAEFAAGGTTGFLTKLIYRGLDALDRGAKKLRPKDQGK